MKRLGRVYFKLLFDYQRFQNHSGLNALIEETAKRRLANDVDFFTLPDEAISALYGAGDSHNAALCPYCGAVLPNGDALLQHIADAHQTHQP